MSWKKCNNYKKYIYICFLQKVLFRNQWFTTGGFIIWAHRVLRYVAPHVGIILCMQLANERWHYNATSFLIGWAHTQNEPCSCDWHVMIPPGQLTQHHIEYQGISITGNSTVCSTTYSDYWQSIHQNYVLLAFYKGIYWWISLTKGQ